MNLIRRDFLLLRAAFNVGVSKRFLNVEEKNPKLKMDSRALLDIEQEFTDIPKENRTKQNFFAALEFFRASRGSKGQGHVEFINTSLKYLKDFGLHKDLDTYKALLGIFPKGVMIPTNVYQKIFLHYPVQQTCCVHLLDEMEYQGVQPDKELHDIVVNTFGDWTYAGKKAKRMMYWMPKLKHTNNYLDRRLVENKNHTALETARIALKMMCRDAGTVLTNVNVTQPNVAKMFGRWIVSAQSPLQRRMLRELPLERLTFYVDGPQFVYTFDKRVEYTVFSCEPLRKDTADEEFIDQRTFQDYGDDLHEKLFDIDPRPLNLHEQAGETILAMCVMEDNTQKMASAWLNHLQHKNPVLERANILIRIAEEERGLEPFYQE